MRASAHISSSYRMCTHAETFTARWVYLLWPTRSFHTFFKDPALSPDVSLQLSLPTNSAGWRLVFSGCLFAVAISHASHFKMSHWHGAVVCQSVWSGAVFQQREKWKRSLFARSWVWSFLPVSPWHSGPLAGCLGSSSLTVVGGVKGPVQAGRRSSERESCHGR